jgi:alpha/beta superfamily hydrolase
VLLLVGCVPAATSTPTKSPLPPTTTRVPPTQTSPATPTSYPSQQVTFQTEDGIEIAGTLYGSGEIAVILAHQGTPGADQTSWQQFAVILAENGFTALTFDFRGVGRSGGVLDYGLLDKDVRAAVHYLQNQQFLQIVCAGASMGGTACLRVAIDDQPFIGLIVLASTFTAGRNDLKVLPEEMEVLTQPKLFITADNDSSVVVRDINRMYDLSPEPKQLLILEGNVHGTNLFQTQVGEELTEAMLVFLKSLSNSPAMHSSYPFSEMAGW